MDLTTFVLLYGLAAVGAVNIVGLIIDEVRPNRPVLRMAAALSLFVAGATLIGYSFI